MPAVEGVRVEGLRQLQSSLKNMGSEYATQFRVQLRGVGEAVRTLAEQKASSEISHIGPDWFRMRLGVTTKVLYVAPRQRRHDGSPRPNLGGLLMEKALIPATAEKQGETLQKFEHLLDSVAAKHGF